MSGVAQSMDPGRASAPESFAEQAATLAGIVVAPHAAST